MTLFGFVKLFMKINNEIKKLVKPFKITRVKFPPNPRNPHWGSRDVNNISEIIVHQGLGEANVEETHEYHISEKSHLKPGVGAPAFAYHYGIDKDGSVYQVNEITDITWHTKGHNLSGIGIMLAGNFAWEENPDGETPTDEQLDSLKSLLHYLMLKYEINKNNIYGHIDFGKPSCPGFVVHDLINDFKKERKRLR